MAEEIQTETNNLIPDFVLDEIEKVSKMEKDLNFLQERQESVEKSVENIQKSSVDQGFIIKDDDGKKSNKDLVETEKLKPNLESVEKKRYENIGIEFVKGASKVFDEIKKAEALKKKMSSKRLESAQTKIEKKEKDNKKKKSGWGSLFLKLGLAIGAVVLVLEVFKNKIDEIMPGFSYNYDNFKEAIIGIGTKITDAISKFLQNTIGAQIKNTFTGKGGVKDTLHTFMVISLPNVILAASLELIKAFGGRVSSEATSMGAKLEKGVGKGLGEGKDKEKEIEERMKRAKDNYSVLSNPFSTERQVAQATSQMGFDSLAAINNDLIENLGKIISNNNDPKINHSSYVTDAFASAFVGALQQNEILKDDKVSDEELKIIYDRLGLTEDYDKWKNSAQVKAMFSAEGISNLKKATEEFNRRLSTRQNRGSIEELNRQLKTTVRKNALKFDGTSTVGLKIEAGKLAQDAFAGKLQEVFDILKTVFSGDKNLGEKLLSSAQSVVKYVYESFLKPIFTIIQNAFPDVQIPNFGSKDKEKKQNPQSLPVVGKNGTVINVTSKTNNPVVVVDLSLDPTTVGGALEIAKVKKELVDVVKKSNDKLQQLKTIQVNLSNKKSINDEEKKDDPHGYKDLLSQHSQEIKFAFEKISNIEEYLEANDKDNQQQPIDDFVILQSR